MTLEKLIVIGMFISIAPFVLVFVITGVVETYIDISYLIMEAKDKKYQWVSIRENLCLMKVGGEIVIYDYTRSNDSPDMYLTKSAVLKAGFDTKRFEKMKRLIDGY